MKWIMIDVGGRGNLNGHVSIFICIFLLYLTEIETLLVTLLFFMLGVTE